MRLTLKSKVLLLAMVPVLLFALVKLRVVPFNLFWKISPALVLVLLLFGRGKISDLMGDVAQGIKAFKKGMQDDEKTAEKPEPVKTIDHNATPSTTARSDVGSKTV